MTPSFDEHERVRWAGRAAAYERSLGALCAYPAGALLDSVGVGANDRILDAGTGPGTVARIASIRGADVVAIDAEPSMLEVAHLRVPAARVCLAALPDLPFSSDYFDAAVGNFVINHVGDPAAAIAELRRVVRPGGRIAVTIWPSPQPPLQQLWGQAFLAAGAKRLAWKPVLSTDKEFARTPEGLSGLLRTVGLCDVGCEVLTWVHRTDPEDWWAGPANGIGTLGQLMRNQTRDMVERIRHEYDRLTEAYRDDDGTLALPTAALLAFGALPLVGDPT